MQALILLPDTGRWVYRDQQEELKEGGVKQGIKGGPIKKQRGAVGKSKKGRKERSEGRGRQLGNGANNNTSHWTLCLKLVHVTTNYPHDYTLVFDRRDQG